jgi:hypothetical protein
VNNNDDKLIKAVRKRAVGYTSEECVEEYAVIDGELQLSKRKVTQKDVPPDCGAVKLLLELIPADPYAQMSEKQLEEEKTRLLGLLKNKT